MPNQTLDISILLYTFVIIIRIIFFVFILDVIVYCLNLKCVDTKHRSYIDDVRLALR